MRQVTSYQEWLKCAAVLVAATGRAMPKEQSDVYYELLSDIPADALRNACLRAIQEQRDNWMPSVGLIRSFAAEAINGTLPNWADEWDHVRSLVRVCGYMRGNDAMRSMTPVTQQAVRAIGWETICDSENISIQAAQFRMAYEQAAKREADLRRISPELRPAITAGPHVTPLLHRGTVSDEVKRLAAHMTPPEEGAA